MTALHIVALAAGSLFWFGLLVVLLRWPGRTFGFAVALLAWTIVGPWAFWAVLGATVLGALARRRCGVRWRSSCQRTPASLGMSRNRIGIAPRTAAVPGPPGVPFDDRRRSPRVRPTDGLVGWRHLVSSSVSRDRADRDPEVGGDVGGRPPISLIVGRRHDLHGSGRCVFSRFYALTALTGYAVSAYKGSIAYVGDRRQATRRTVRWL